MGGGVGSGTGARAPTLLYLRRRTSPRWDGLFWLPTPAVDVIPLSRSPGSWAQAPIVLPMAAYHTRCGQRAFYLSNVIPILCSFIQQKRKTFPHFVFAQAIANERFIPISTSLVWRLHCY